MREMASITAAICRAAVERVGSIVYLASCMLPKWQEMGAPTSIAAQNQALGPSNVVHALSFPVVYIYFRLLRSYREGGADGENRPFSVRTYSVLLPKQEVSLEVRELGARSWVALALLRSDAIEY